MEEEEDSAVLSEVKIEIDIAEEPSQYWMTEQRAQGEEPSQYGMTEQQAHEIKTENVGDFSNSSDGNVVDSRCTCDTTERDAVKCELKQETDTDGDDKPALSHGLDAQLYENDIDVMRAAYINQTNLTTDRVKCEDKTEPDDDVLQMETEPDDDVHQVKTEPDDDVHQVKTEPDDDVYQVKTEPEDDMYQVNESEEESKSGSHLPLFFSPADPQTSVPSPYLSQGTSATDPSAPNNVKRIMVCTICTIAFTNISELRKHILIHETEQKNHVCDVCNKTFARATMLKLHKSICSAKNHACEFCKKTFTQSCHLKQHMLIHTGPNTYVCQKNRACHESPLPAFSSPAEPQTSVPSPYFSQGAIAKDQSAPDDAKRTMVCDVHQVNESEESESESPLPVFFDPADPQTTVPSPFLSQGTSAKDPSAPDDARWRRMCGVCTETFPNISELEKHKLIHETEQKNHECDVCNKTFFRATMLKLHKSICSGEKNRACHLCKQTFTQSCHLEQHMLIHTGPNTYVCHICGKPSKNTNNLRTHMLIHTKRKFVCDVCDKTFTRAWAMAEHKKTHTRERDHECDVCYKQFCAAGFLKQHMLKIHTRMNHLCDVCGESFRLLQSLKAHKFIHTGHVCGECDKAFKYAYHLKKHKLIHSASGQKQPV